ncbi:MAG: DNA cytosine methyltransferase [Eggerthellaceae bacterium]|nr:DNA cytosine methyltransferase [Eggerthellaceae bacterium]
MTVVDLFSGCGGMSLGFKNAGFELLAAYDNWQPALDVYKCNFDSPAFLRDLSDESVVDEISALRPDVIIGGPPCQDFSQAGKRSEGGGRAILTVRYGEIIAECRPKLIVMENVPRVRTSKAMESIRTLLKDCGYGLTGRVLDASRCGVPQARKRFFLVGCLGADDEFLGEILDANLANHQMTIREYLGDSLGTDYYFRIPRSYDRRAIFSIDEPAMTMRGVDRPIPPNYKLHPNDAAPLNEARCLTPKERSRIQTFPEEFEFFGTKTDVNQMIGNAVPVNMAEYVARAILEYFEGGADALC